MNNKYVKFILFISALLIIGFFFAGELVPVKNFFYKLTSPISKRFLTASDSIGGFFSNLKEIGKLARKNSDLEKTNNELNSKLAALTEVEHENEILKKELGFSNAEIGRELVPSRVVNRSSSSFFQTIRIDKGVRDGVTKGRPVLSEGYLIGIIEDSSDSFSDVTLITNNRLLVAVILQESRGTGLLKGGLGGLTVEDVPLDTQIKKEEIVVTSGMGDGLPSGLAIGKVQDVISSQSEIFQRATVKSPVELGKIEFVFVLK